MQNRPQAPHPLRIQACLPESVPYVSEVIYDVIETVTIVNSTVTRFLDPPAVAEEDHDAAFRVAALAPPEERDCSPPPCGEGLGVGVGEVARYLDGCHARVFAFALPLDPHPVPPHKGEGVICATDVFDFVWSEVRQWLRRRVSSIAMQRTG